MTHLAALFAQVAASKGAAPALIERSGRRVSFAALAAQAEAFAGHLAARGIGKGDRMLVAMGVGADLYATLAGLWRIGAVAVFPEPALGLAGLRHAVAAARPRAVVTTWPYTLIRALPWLWGLPGFHPRRGGPPPPLAALGADEPALISFTSGTSGAPKGIVRSQGFLMAQRAAVARLLDSPEPEIDLVAFPVFVLINLAAGRCSALPNWGLARQDQVTAAALAAWIAQTGATRALLPPALAERLTTAPRPAPLHTVFTGGGPVFPDVLAGLQGMSLRAVAVYGSTEAEPIAHLEAANLRAEDLAAMRAGAGLLAGPPVPQVRLRLEDGEIWVAGDHVNQGYLDPARDAEAKVRDAGGTVWHRTGDAGRLDEGGQLWLLGRRGSVVQGPKGPLYPFAVETAARSWPGVTRAALAEVAGAPVLAVEGDARHQADWTARAARLGITRVAALDRLPLDRRHRSKIDPAALKQRLGDGPRRNA